jgi:hypothetical protein
MQNDDMDEPHPYEGVSFSKENPQDIYPLGNLNYRPVSLRNQKSLPQPNW